MKPTLIRSHKLFFGMLISFTLIHGIVPAQENGGKHPILDLLPAERIPVCALAKTSEQKLEFHFAWGPDPNQQLLIGKEPFANFVEAVKKCREDRPKLPDIVAVHLDGEAKCDRLFEVIDLFHYRIKPPMDIAIAARPKADEQTRKVVVLKAPEFSVFNLVMPPEIRISGPEDYEVDPMTPEMAEIFPTEVPQSRRELAEELVKYREQAIGRELRPRLICSLKSNLTVQEFLRALEPLLAAKIETRFVSSGDFFMEMKMKQDQRLLNPEGK